MRKKKVGLSYVNITHIHPVLNTEAQKHRVFIE